MSDFDFSDLKPLLDLKRKDPKAYEQYLQDVKAVMLDFMRLTAQVVEEIGKEAGEK